MSAHPKGQSGRLKEIPVCGLAAVQALFEQNPDAIKRLFFDAQTGRKVAAISSFLAKTRRVYRVVPAEELQKISGTVHHHGIVAITETKPLRTPGPHELKAWAAAREPLVLLDRVGNAHNLGAIARTAAFLGVRHIIVPQHAQQAMPSEAAHRVAEGGMAHVEIWTVPELSGFCRLLAKNYHVIGAATGGGSKPVTEVARAEASGTMRAPPVALVLGNEEHGMSREVAAACTRLVTIPASNPVESLNVSVAAAILMWELWGRKR